VSWLPWGSDVLGLGSCSTIRPWDVMRVGRQPDQWEDDASNEEAARTFGIAYHPRPHGHESWQENQTAIMTACGSAKFVLAFSNTAHRSTYTHPSRQYLTARWTDALASGAVVAGIPPREPSIDEMLWTGATLDLKTLDRHKGLSTIVEALGAWEPALVRTNHLMALQRLDWRWRFAEILRLAALSSTPLETELGNLRQQIEKVRLNCQSSQKLVG
jgi:hypothetical protein